MWPKSIFSATEPISLEWLNHSFHNSFVPGDLFLPGMFFFCAQSQDCLCREPSVPALSAYHKIIGQLQLISVWCCSESNASTVPPSPWAAEGCTGPGGLTAGQETGNEMGVSLTALRNTSVLWPSAFTGIRCGFLLTCLSGDVWESHFYSCRELCMRPDRFSPCSSIQMQILGRGMQR